MCDRITQVQDQINQVRIIFRLALVISRPLFVFFDQIADHMCNAVGILQQSAVPSVLPGRETLLSNILKNESADFQPKGAAHCSLSFLQLLIWEIRFSLDLPALFAALIARSAKELEVLIDHLPNDSNSAEEVCFSISECQAISLFQIAAFLGCAN